MLFLLLRALAVSHQYTCTILYYGEFVCVKLTMGLIAIQSRSDMYIVVY